MYLAFQYVAFLAMAAVSGQDVSDVIMYISYEGNNNYIIDFKFTSKVFKSLYQCMCRDTTSRCHISYDYDHVMQVVQSESSKSTFLPPCQLYTCTNSRQSPLVTCVTLQQTDSCARQIKPTYVSLNVASSCAASCVGIVWNLDKERIVFNDQELGVRQCSEQCCSGQTSEKPLAQNESSTERVFVNETINEIDYQDTIIVAGIAGGVILVTIIVFVVFLLLKHRSATSAGQRENDNITQSSTNGTNHSFYQNTQATNKTSTHTNDGGKDASKKLQPTNPFARFDLSNAKHNLGHQHNINGTDDTHNKPAHNKHENKAKESGKHLFKRKSNKPAGFNDAVPDDDGDTHKIEGDYAEIDDYQIQDCNSLEYIADSTEVDLNDGYSTVDNSDYYNIQHNTPGSADSESGEGSADTSNEASLSADTNMVLQASGHQTPNAPVPKHNLSEYFVAGAISGDAATYSMGQPVDGAASDLNTRLEQGHDNASDNASDNDNTERKRTSYFILEKETEEEDI